MIIETQLMVWKLHNCMSISWGFFVMNNGLPINLVNSQNLLHCIICKYRSKQLTMFWFKNSLCTKIKLNTTKLMGSIP
jgi:hypothetical protein